MSVADPFGWAGSIVDGQFSVEAVAGEGAFGVVYRGRHLGFDLPIAIKCLKIPESLDSEEQAEILSRFREEGRILHRLSRLTPSVVQALHTGAVISPTGRWTPYLVMEWLDGTTLQDELLRRSAQGLGPLPLDEAIALLSPVAEALAVAHRENVSHRDVKPANVFLVPSRERTLVKLVDFGIAKVFSEAPSLTGALAGTGLGYRPFTPQYGAPEQFSAQYGATGPWTDVFALALLLVELASGTPALDGSNVMQLFVSAADDARRPSLSDRGAPSSPALEAVLTKALAVRPALRFPNAGEMWAEILAAHDGEAGSDLRATQREGLLPTEPAPALFRTSPAIAAGGENRICTVACIDLSETAELSDRLDAEHVEELLDRCFAAVKEAIEAHGGVAFETAGEQLTAVFGAPRATEADPERAVLAALRAQDTIARIALPRGLAERPLAARIGVATGRVFVSDAAFTQRRRSIAGDAVNAAARLQRAAPRGAIVVGRDTYRAIASLFHVVPFDAKPEKSGAALPAYRIIGPAAARHPLAPSDFHGMATSFVGRRPEMLRLLDAFEASATEPSARLITLVGPAGAGRSRVLAELFGKLMGGTTAALVAATQCTPRTKETSYGLAAALLRQKLEIHEADGPDVVRRKLVRGVRWFRRRHLAPRPQGGALAEEEIQGPELAGALASIATILGAQGEVERTDAGFHDGASSLAKHRIAAAAAGLLRLVARRIPIVILCDDAQWADDASLDLLDEIAARAADLPIFIVCSARPEILERRPRRDESRAHERVDIDLLPRRHVEEMIRDRLRRVPEVSADLVRLLADRADGSPLTLVETLHLLVDLGVIEVSREGPWAVHEERLGSLALPATVQGIVQARLDRLDSASRDALLRAAVIGRTFWEDALDHLRREDPSSAEGWPTAEILAQLRERHLLRAREPPTFAGEREHEFAELATQEVAYEMLSSKLRRRLHLVAARWLKTRVRGGPGAALLALHYDRGGSPAEAAAEYSRAAAHAASLGENREALRLLERAGKIHDDAEGADLASATADQGDRRIATWTERVRLRMDLGDVLRRTGSLDGAERAYEAARARILRDERRKGAVTGAAAALRWEARADYRMALVHRLRGATAQARALVERAIERATEAGARGETLPMYAMLAFLQRRERTLDAAFRTVRKGLRVCRSIEQRDEHWREDAAELLFGVGAALFGRGRMAGAERSYRQGLRLLDETKSPHLAGIAYNGMAASRLGRGDRRAAREMFLKALRVKERVGDLHQIAVAYSNLAEVELALKEARAALDHARRAVDIGERIRAGYDLAEMYRNLAEALLATGDVEGALPVARKSLGVAEVAGRVYLGDVALTLARVSAKAAAQGGPLLASARSAAEALRASLSRHEDDADLRAKAEACESLLRDAGLGPAAPQANGT